MSRKPDKPTKKAKENQSDKSNGLEKIRENEEKLNFEGNTNRNGEGHMYDKIMRENLQELFLPLVADQLNLKIKHSEVLADKQPTTIIRETDAFLKIKTDSKEEPEFILHLEFESKDDEEMVYRMSEYHGIEMKKFRLPIKHVVVYLGERNPKMRTKLKPSEIFEGFTLVNAKSFSSEKWLETEEPSKIIMAILGDYQKKNAKIILKAIFDKLRKVCNTEAELKKYINQLIIISRMRKLEQLTIKLSKEMPITIDIEKDYLYNLGLKKADELVKKAKEMALTAKKQAEQLAEEKAKLEAKAAKEKAKAVEEKVKLEAKIKEDKIILMKKMKAKGLTNDEIFEFSNLDKAEFKEYLKLIEEK